MNIRSRVRTYVFLAVAVATTILSIACGGASVNPDMGRVAESILSARTSYDTSRSFNDLVKPHFFATSEDREQLDIQGDPELIQEIEGRIKVRLNFEGQELFVDLLALESELLGDHPIHKVWRLRAMGIPVDDDLLELLRPPRSDQSLFRSVTFQYLPEQEVSGVISEIFPDGTFLITPVDTPYEWQSDQPEISSPTHLHVNPRALNVKESRLAAAYEQEILSLPFDDQRYPPPSLAKQQCEVYQESLLADEYVSILSDAGYRFTAGHVGGSGDDGGTPFGEQLSSLLQQGAGNETSYFGFENYWVSDRLAELAAPWMGDCDSAVSPQRYRQSDSSSDQYYIVVRRSLEPEKTQRYKILLLASDGSAKEIYTAPGIVLMAQPLPNDDNKWLLSTEGWQAPEGDTPPDPRWKSVYLVDMRSPEEYSSVQYPIAQFPKAPGTGLYGVSPVLSPDRRFLMNTLYGFKDEGGGIWVSDLSSENYHTKPEQFSRVVSWDHTLSWTRLERDTEESAAARPYYHLFMTGKEVADDFAMTANILRVRDAGLSTSVVYQDRLLQMVGWNPVPFAMQRLSDQKFRIAVETHFNYESSLLPRAKGVYIVPVDLEEIDYSIVP